MQDYANSNRLSVKTTLFFIAVLLIAFLPVSSFLFFLKNDAFNGYFPPKFFMSECIHAGHLPLWNPYINYGFPQYGDMSGGYWSPITWLIASSIGYNAYTLTIELLFYIFLGGIGMYQLANYWKLGNPVCIVTGVAFMCCGYTVGHLQHFNWLSGAAFLPWCCWSYLLLMKKLNAKNLITAALFFYLLASSAHPGITISAMYFFIGMAVYIFFENRHQLTITARIKNIGLAHITLFLLVVALSIGMITGYLDILPHFVRGEKISLADSLSHPTNLQSWISALLPLATVKNNSFYNTDPSMRNCYFSLGLLIFFLFSIFQKQTGWQKLLLLAGTLFMLLSAGGIFKTIAYKYLPLVGYVRLNGEFSIFTILCFIMVAAIQLNKFINQKSQFEGTIKRIYYAIEITVIACIIYGLYMAIGQKDSFLYKHNNLFTHKSISLQLKALVDSISFYDTFWLQGFIQLLLLWAIKWCLRFQQWNLLKKIIIADMVLASLLNIPYTGVGKASVADVQSVLNKSPRGIPAPVLQPIDNIDSLSIVEKELTGDWSMYNKEIGTRTEVPYPIILKGTRAYFENIDSFPARSFLSKPFVFTGNPSKDSIHIQNFAPGKITFTVSADSANQLIVQQNYYPHWFYNNGNEQMEVNRAGIGFMSAPLVKGNNTINFSFEPIVVKRAMLFSTATFIACCLLLLFFSTRRKEG